MKKTALKLMHTVTVIGLVFGMAACGSSQSRESDDSDMLPPVADAGTDVLPDSGEMPPPLVETSVPAVSDSDVPKPIDSTVTAHSDSSFGSDTYTVKSGDTLMKIAYEVYGDLFRWREIYEINREKISDPNSISKGTVLKVNSSSKNEVAHQGDKYMIKKGDSLGSISGQLYGTRSRWKELWENNKDIIRNPNKIFAGFYLYYLQGGDSPSAVSKASTQEMGSPSAGASSDIPPLLAPAP